MQFQFFLVPYLVIPEKLKQLKNKNNQLVYNESLLNQEADVVSLIMVLEKYRSAIGEKEKLEKQKKDLTMNIRDKIEKINQEWSENTIKEYELSYSEKDKIRTFKEDINNTKKQFKYIPNIN